ncbi:DUF6895 family protein [Streptomyces broussonetiae]|uniref:DUF6895 domain-containing protein n=1 Tax=Streptomyces broussonetiae TaxID=2686304 RepID=A0ABV5EGK4_9ACTN
MTGAHPRPVAREALAWVSAHRDRFRLDDAALAVDGEVNRSWKPLGELAQVCSTVTARTPRHDPLHACASDLLDFAWRETGRGELFGRVQGLEPFATYPLEVYAAFASAGLRHPGYEASAAVVARTRGWRSTEQYPTRRLGVLGAERRGGIPPHEPVTRALERTWLGALPEPWTFERAAGYAVTHVVFHLTDWGRAPEGVPPRLTDYLLHWLPPWLDTCLEARMWDLGCELLAVAASLPRPPEPEPLAEAWERVTGARRPSGAIPEEGGAYGTGDEFADCYHSTLMAAFAAALTLARPAHDGAPHRAAPSLTAVPDGYGGRGALG